MISIAYCGHFGGSTDANFQMFREDQTEQFIIHWETSNRKRVDVVANSSQPPWHKSQARRPANNSSRLAPAIHCQLAPKKKRKISPTTNLARGHPSPQVLVGGPSRLAWYTRMHHTRMHSHTLCCVKIAVLYRPEISKGASIWDQHGSGEVSISSSWGAYNIIR